VFAARQATLAAVAVRRFAADTSAFRSSTLPNGVRVATEKLPGETATVGVFIDTGSRYENENNNGVAHFLEHMAFKGTGKRSQRDLELEVENMGGHLNAYTSRENTVYYAKVFKDQIGKGVDILSDILLNSTYGEAEIERERGVILREMEEVENTMSEAIFDRLHETAYQGTALGRTILGPEENIRRISQKDLKEYVKTQYTGPRIVVSAAGAVDHDQIVELAGKAFGQLSSESGNRSVEEVRYTGSDILVFNNDLPRTHVAVAVQGVGWQHPDAYGLQVMQSIIGAWDRNAGGSRHLSSKLAAEVQEHELATSFMSFNTMYNDTGLFGCYAVCERRDEQTLDDLVYAIENEWVRLCFNVTQGEVEKAKNQLKASLLVQMDGSTAVCEDIGRQLLTMGRRLTPAEIFRNIDRITVNDIRRIASTYIYDQDPVMAMIGDCKMAPDYNRLRKWTHWYRT